MLQFGKHYRICSSSGVELQDRVVGLVNAAQPAKTARLNGPWEPIRRINSLVAVPTEDVLQAVQRLPGKLGLKASEGWSHMPRSIQKQQRKAAAMAASARKRHPKAGELSPSAETGGQQASPAETETVINKATAQMFKSVFRSYGPVLGCITLQWSYWKDFWDLYGVPAAFPGEYKALKEACRETLGVELQPKDTFIVVDQVAVSPSLQRSGIGTALVQHVVAAAAEGGAQYVYTHTTDDHPGADKFWSKQTWQDKKFVEVRRNFRSGYNAEGRPDSQLTIEYVMKLV